MRVCLSPKVDNIVLIKQYRVGHEFNNSQPVKMYISFILQIDLLENQAIDNVVILSVVTDDMIIVVALSYTENVWRWLLLLLLLFTIVVGLELKAIDDIVGRGRRGRDVRGWLCLIILMMKSRLFNQNRVWLMILVLSQGSPFMWYFSLCSLQKSKTLYIIISVSNECITSDHVVFLITYTPSVS